MCHNAVYSELPTRMNIHCIFSLLDKLHENPWQFEKVEIFSCLHNSNYQSNTNITTLKSQSQKVFFNKKRWLILLQCLGSNSTCIIVFGYGTWNLNLKFWYIFAFLFDLFCKIEIKRKITVPCSNYHPKSLSSICNELGGLYLMCVDTLKDPIVLLLFMLKQTICQEISHFEEQD